MLRKELTLDTRLASGIYQFAGWRRGQLHNSIECHACFEWLFPILYYFWKNWSDVDVDIWRSLAFDALSALPKEDVYPIVSSDPDDLKEIKFVPLFDYSPVFAVALSYPLAKNFY